MPSTHPARRHKGFTLLELIVVVVVIAVLASIAIVGYQRVVANTKDASVQATVASLGREVTSLGAFDDSIDEADVVAAGADLTGGWVLAGTEGDSATVHGTVAWALLDGAAGFAALSETGHAIYGCAAINFTFARIDKTDTVAADPLDALPCDEATYNPTPTTAPPSWPIVATGGDSQITVTFDGQPGATSYEAACWTAAMTQTNAMNGTASVAEVVIEGLQNYVSHTCQVTAIGATGNAVSDTDTAIPSGSPVTPTTPVPQPVPNGTTVEVVVEDDECFGCDPFTPTVPTNPDVDGLWDLTSMYSTHTGSHRLFAVDRGAGVVVSLVDYGTWASSAEAYSWLNDSNTGTVNFDEPTGLAYGAHPARTSSSSVTSFSVLYLTDAGTGNIWMLEPSARRATLVGTGFDEPTGVAWAACTDVNSGARTTLMGATQCLYVADLSGVSQMPLQVSTGSIFTALPVVADAADAVAMSATAAVKVTASNSLVSSEAANVIARAYSNTTVSTTAGSAPAGSTVIPASITGTTALVVFADAGDHSIKTFNPAAPSSVTTVAGTGAAGYVDAVGTSAAFNSPKGLHFHGNWPYVYVADTGNGLLRRVNLVTGDTITLYGTHPFRIVLRDNFNRTAGTSASSLGVTHIGFRPWQRAEGTSLLTGSSLSFGPCCTAADNTVLVEGYTGDASVSAVVDRNSPPAVVARWQDTDNFLYVNWVSGVGYPTYCYIRLSQMAAGVSTQIATHSIRSAGSCNTTDYAMPIGIRVFGDQAQILLNEVAVSVTGTVVIPDTVTRHGIWRSYYGLADDFSFIPLSVDTDQVTPPEIQNWDTTGTDVNVTMTPLTSRDTIDADRYELLRDGTVIHSFDPAGPYTHTDTGLTAGQTYDYTIRLVDAYGHISAESPSRLIDVADNPGTYIEIADDFARPTGIEIDSTSLGDVRWQKVLGAAQISSAGLRLAPGNSTTSNAAIVESYSGDTTVQAVANGDPHRTGSVVARWQDPQNFLSVSFVSGIGFPTYCYVRLSQTVAGVTAQLATFSIRGAGSCGAADYAKPIGIRAFGNTAQIMFDGAAVSAPVATAISDQNTRHGVYAYTFNPQSFSDFSLTPLPIDETQVVPPQIRIWDTSGSSVDIEMTPLSPVDSIDATGYELLRDGTVIHTFPAAGPYTFTDTGRPAGQTIGYTLRVVDTYGHRSVESPVRDIFTQNSPPTPIVVADTFARADSAELGSTSTGSVPWQKTIGVTTISGGRMRLGPGNATTTNAAIVEAYSGDVTVEALTNLVSASASAAVVARWQDENNHLRVQYVSASGWPSYCQLRLTQVSAGVATTLTTLSLSGFSSCSAATYDTPIGIRAYGTSAQIMRGGIPVSSPVSTVISDQNSRHGAYAYVFNPATVSNFTMTPLAIDTGQVVPPQIGIWDTSGSNVNITMTPLAATDTIDAVGYELLRDGTVIHTFPTAGPYTHTDAGRPAGQTFGYTLRVVDVFGNRSGETAVRNVRTANTPGTPVALSDTFTRADSPDIGSTEGGAVAWQKALGTSSISAGRLRLATGSGTTVNAAIVETYSGNGTLTATVNNVSNNSPAIVARWQDQNNHLRIQIWSASGWPSYCQIRATQYAGGIATTIATHQLGSSQCASTIYDTPIGVRLSGTSAQLMYGGVDVGLPGTVAISSANTRHGLYAYTSSYTTASTFNYAP